MKLKTLLDKLPHRPWSVWKTSGFLFVNSLTRSIARIEDQRMATEKQADAVAAYLVHAANTLPDAVEALGRAVAYMEYHGKDNPRMQLFAATLRPALQRSQTVKIL